MSDIWNIPTHSSTQIVSSASEMEANSWPPRAFFDRDVEEDFRRQINLAILTAPTLTDTQLTALQLHGLGLNPFPVLYGSKDRPPTWKSLQFSRLPAQDLPLIFSGQCNIAVMCGRTSRNLVVIDCETPEAFAYHLIQLKKRGIAMWAVETARGGHLWFFCAEGEVKNIAKGIIPDAEIRGCNCYVLCPPSRHPTGVDYRWVHEDGLHEPPTINVDQIDWLRDHDGHPVKLKTSQSRRNQTSSKRIQQLERIARKPHVDHDPRLFQLSNTTLDYLEYGSNLAEGTRNRRLFRAACDMLGCGYTDAEVRRWLTPIARASDLPEDGIQSTLQSVASAKRIGTRAKYSNSLTPRPLDWRYAQAYTNSIGGMRVNLFPQKHGATFTN